MFTGIVEGTGVIAKNVRVRKGAHLEIQPNFRLKSLRRGDSIAVNGCCLTVVGRRGRRFAADLSSETLRVTNLGRLRAGERVNLERPVRLSDRLGGHLVQGHIDAEGRVLAARRNGRGLVLEIGFSAPLRRYLIPKGSVAVDGVSMTVNGLKRDRFTLHAIPETLKVTNFRDRREGDLVNLEVDIVGKYIESFLRKR